MLTQMAPEVRHPQSDIHISLVKQTSTPRV